MRDPRIDELLLKLNEIGSRGGPTRHARLAAQVQAHLVEIAKLRAEVEVANRQVVHLSGRDNYDSIRGPYTYNNNHHPIQNFYEREVVLGDDGKPKIVTRGIVFKDHQDSYSHLCKMKW